VGSERPAFPSRLVSAVYVPKRTRAAIMNIVEGGGGGKASFWV
jgi:hypothetical protein